MAALCESFTLCGLGPSGGVGLGGGLLALQPGPDRDHVLLTDRGRTATLFKVSDQKPLGCWSVKHGQIITCPVVCNFETHEYIAVHDDKVLRIWKDKDINLDKVFKATLSADVYRIHSLPNGGPLVLFKGGGVRTLDVLLEAPQQEIENVISDEVIKWSEAFNEGQQPILIFATEKDGDFFVYVKKLKMNSLHKYKLEQQELSKPLSFTAYIKNKIITLLCLYSNYSVYKFLIPLQQNSEEEEQILSKSLLLNLLVSGSVLKGTSFVVLDKDHIAVLGSLGASGDECKECLTIWNTKFQTLQTSKELPLGTSGQLWCYEEKFFFTHGKVLTVIMYKCETSSLAAAVGKLKDSQTPDVSSFVNWNTLGDEELAVSVHSQQSVALKSESRMTDASTTVLEDELRQLMSKAQMPDFQAAIGCVITALINRCKTDPKYYPQNFLLQIVQTRDLSYSLCPDLMAVALEKKDVYLLQNCLQRFPDIPEEITYACLKVFLSLSEAYLQRIDVNLESVICYIDTEFNSKDVKTEIVENGFNAELEQDIWDTKITKKRHLTTDGELCPVGPQKAALLNAVLLSAYSETFLLPHLKNLPAQQAVLFLRYLYYLYVKCSEKINTTLPGVRSPNINQIMDWMCLLLDAHFTVMVMLPEAKELLSNLHKFVRAQVRFYSELNKIEGSLRELQRLNHQKDSQTYSIEVLELI
ncbi:nucleolar protein 11 isoform X2 [Falco biarmicus]|uniref:nucleolar protein 11 isoform X2 n=1 Tax=Falco cherrug TaxID=345164 RepID=UPI00247B22C3|nr:nucleolar protein 11 isoform X2 [Falco cherrug]XP_055652571.1 nucleolar protein 11 isoform X2 [Falco peregrinus]XP_056205581.1 nucleolar protein 11 isoform X2 [Falco biarmicus]